MKKMIQSVLLLTTTVGMAAFAEETVLQPIKVSAATAQAAITAPTVDANQKGGTTVLVSPRTGMRYSLTNPANRKVIFQTEALAPVTAQNVSRIRASNPALSEQSQQQAEKALLDMVGIVVPVVEPMTVEAQTATAN
ncbi:MAG: hypothetical protein E6Q25_01940 [Acinetobacter sp.]|jgi:hypothetical protein|nr:MAG: hypothetical protein E6Q25_01940 [Acinetobacter sp.]